MRGGSALRWCWAAVLVLAAAEAAMAAETAAFQRAKPVWPAGREKEMNLQVGFRAVIERPADAAKGVLLRVAAQSFYRARSTASSSPPGRRGPRTASTASTRWISLASWGPDATWWPSRWPATMSTASTYWINRRSARRKSSAAIASWRRRRVNQGRRSHFGPPLRVVARKSG